ncbi:SpoIIE family protein phosphatase [Endothiovibrio diazotrophicus]
MSEEKQTILVVDDTPENIDLLNQALGDRYTVRAAISGERALKIVATPPHPELILLDVMMPGMDGYEVCRRLKADEATRDLPVVFVTARGEIEDEVKGFSLGAVDYVTKPIQPEIVRTRVATHLALHRARRELAEKNEALRNERELVEEIVTRMRSTAQLDQDRLRYLISPLERTNGDLLLAARRPDGGRHVLLGDFTGHGLPAAIGGPMAAYIFSRFTAAGEPMAEILRELNRVLYRQLPAHLYMAACALEISPGGDRVSLWNAGVPDALLIRDGEVTTRFPSTAPPLGIIEAMDPAADAAHHPLLAGDRLYAYSDGVTEAAGEDGEQFGEGRLEIS